ncbi:MAG: hypothetical protein H6598_03220 [Flavobacteriales bacterium]|nr:hypothetical protein [Flavobacteriales bacterium]
MKSKLISGVFLALGAFVMMSGSCEKKEITCNGTNTGYTYQKDIKPIIDENCTGCHEGYSSFTGLNVSVQNGEFEREVITRQTMPQGSKLSVDQLIMIKCWLDNGAKEN